MNRLPILLLSAALSASAAEPATKPAAKVSTDWVGTDRYDRPMAEFAEAGPKRPDKVVGMFYYLWHGQHTPPWGNDVTKYFRNRTNSARIRGRITGRSRRTGITTPKTRGF